MEKFERERLIVECLCHGLPVADIAAQLDVSEKRMRAIIREILASRMPAPPEEYVAIQVSRLNEALILAHSARTELALKKVDRVLRITRELDFYDGFGSAKRRRSRSASARLETPAEGALAFGAALICRAEYAPQDETIQPAPAPESAVAAPAPDKTSGTLLAPEESAALADRPQNPSQQVEKIDSAPGLDAPWSAWRAWEERNRTAWTAAALEPPQPAHAAVAPPADRPENPSQQIENLESAPGVEAPCSAPGDRESEPTAPAAALEPPPAAHATAASLADLPQNPSQQLEYIESAPVAGEAGEAPRRHATHESGGRPVDAVAARVGATTAGRPENPQQSADSEPGAGHARPPGAGVDPPGPAVPTPDGPRWKNVRLALNGTYAA